MAELTVVARAKAKPGKERDLEAIWQATAGASRRESGCVRYQVYRAAADSRIFISIEVWGDQAAAEAHMQSPHVASLIAKVPELVEGTPQIESFLAVS